MKRILATILLLGAVRAAGQIVYLEVTGIVESTSTNSVFAAGRPYSFRFSFELGTTPTQTFSDVATYSGAATSIVFNYDAGAYVGTASNLSIWVQNSASGGDGFAVGMPFSGSVNFDPVDGQSLYNGAGTPVLDLFDATGSALSSTALLNLAAGVPQFLSGGDDRLRLRWGSNAEILVVATVDAINSYNGSGTAIPEPSGGAAVAGGLVMLRLFWLRKLTSPARRQRTSSADQP